MRTSLPIALAGVLAAGSLSLVAAAPATADIPECHSPKITITTKVGQAVWIPTNRGAGAFQHGGSQSISKGSGKMTATTNGSADTVGAGGSVGIGVAEVSAKYDRQWNRNTARTTSKTKTFTTNSPVMSKKVHWRWKLYKQGRLFNATKTVRRPKICQGASVQKGTFRVVVPLNRGEHTFKAELFSKRDQVRNANFKPMGF